MWSCRRRGAGTAAVEQSGSRAADDVDESRAKRCCDGEYASVFRQRLAMWCSRGVRPKREPRRARISECRAARDLAGIFVQEIRGRRNRTIEGEWYTQSEGEAGTDPTAHRHWPARSAPPSPVVAPQRFGQRARSSVSFGRGRQDHRSPDQSAIAHHRWIAFRATRVRLAATSRAITHEFARNT
jgi:hypothetical protein